MKTITCIISCLFICIITEGQGTYRPDSSFVSKQDVVTAKIYPNPATNKVEVLVNGFQPGILELKVIDRNGMVYRDDKRLLVNGNEVIVLMFMLPPDIYFIETKPKINKEKTGSAIILSFGFKKILHQAGTFFF